MSKAKTKEKEEPIYEKLEPGSCMIISKSGKEFTYACNKNGEIKLKKVKLSEED